MKNLPLLVGLALPLLFILVIVGVLYVPTLYVKPAHDFIYTMDTNYYEYYRNRYVVSDERLTREPVPPTENREFTSTVPKLYRYDVDTLTATQIDEDEAMRLSLTPGPSSPDGYRVEYRYSHSGLFELFGGGGRDSGYVIANQSGAKPLPGLSGSPYSNSVELLGWVTE